MRRRTRGLVASGVLGAAAIAASCALNAGGIEYLPADGGPGSGDGSAGDGTTAGDGGSGDGGNADGSSGPCAADQVFVDAGFCIDKTEVTNERYIAFLIATGSDGGGTGACAGTTVFEGPGPESFAHPQFPIRGVDWCAAKEYCEWAGKRLCGTIEDGGELPYDNFAFKDAAASEWFYACTANGGTTYPYGGVNDGGGFDGGACNGMDLGEGGPVDVGSLPNCIGGYPGIHDMSGNVWEWENSCADDTSKNASCLIRGGSFQDGNEFNLRCDNSGTLPSGVNRNQALGNVGIRCCSNPKP